MIHTVLVGHQSWVGGHASKSFCQGIHYILRNKNVISLITKKHCYSCILHSIFEWAKNEKPCKVFVVVRTWKHILTKMPLNQCPSYESQIFLTVTYEELRSIKAYTYLLKHFTYWWNKSLNKILSKMNYIDNKYLQSSDYIVWELLKTIKGNKNSTKKSGLFSFCSSFWSCSSLATTGR